MIVTVVLGLALTLILAPGCKRQPQGSVAGPAVTGSSVGEIPGVLPKGQRPIDMLDRIRSFRESNFPSQSAIVDDELLRITRTHNLYGYPRAWFPSAWSDKEWLAQQRSLGSSAMPMSASGDAARDRVRQIVLFSDCDTLAADMRDSVLIAEALARSGVEASVVIVLPADGSVCDGEDSSVAGITISRQATLGQLRVGLLQQSDLVVVDEAGRLVALGVSRDQLLLAFEQVETGNPKP